jgi:hypothetical protein
MPLKWHYVTHYQKDYFLNAMKHIKALTIGEWMIDVTRALWRHYDTNSHPIQVGTEMTAESTEGTPTCVE